MTNSLEPGFSPEPSTPRVAWRWRLEDRAGLEVSTSLGSPTFPSQSDAESWIGEVYRDLAEEGVDSVTLLEGDREVYAGMSLHPAE